jgi:hypothetical protein
MAKTVRADPAHQAASGPAHVLSPAMVAQLSPALIDETARRALVDAARLCGRVRVVPDAEGGTPRLLPVLAPPDLWRVLPRLARRLADLIDAGFIPAEPGVSPDNLRAVADLIERGGSAGEVKAK